MTRQPAFPAYRLTEQPDGSSIGTLVEMSIDALDEGDLLVQVHYAGINYKDALGGLGRAKVMQRLPCNGGIEAVGVVVASGDPAFREGDEVIVHGRGIGVRHDGGLAGMLRVPSAWALPLPAGMSARETAIVGVAGHTAAMSIDAMELNGLDPSRGPVAVTGATGGVASIAIDMLSNRGYEVVAVTRKADATDYLLGLGASRVVAAPDPLAKAKPLESATWAGAIDAAGGPMLAWLLRSMAQHGTVAAFGNAAGIALNTTVLPFILRGVRLLGINADSDMPLRTRLWLRTATDLRPSRLDAIATMIAPTDIGPTMQAMLDGRTRGRHIVSFR
ncbi:MAG: acryloyl-CoA reductase [Lautropia sp.]